MSTIFNMLILIISIIGGSIITSFTILSAVICLTFCIPLTKDLEKENLIVKNNPIIKRYRGSATFLTIVFCVVTFFVIRFGSPAVQIGYVLGFAYIFFKIIFNMNQVGINQGNVSDYVKTDSNSKYFNKISPAQGTPVDDVLNYISIIVFADYLSKVSAKIAKKENLNLKIKAKTSLELIARMNEIFKDAIRVEPETDEGKFARAESQKYALHVTQLVRVGMRTATDVERESQIRSAFKK